MSIKIEPRQQADDCVILNQRLLAYSRELVWDAWTRPERLARWWGPKGFSNSFHEFDLRPGGYWRFTMHGPDGSEYPSESRFVELVEPERIVFDHLSGHVFRVTASLAGHQSGTLLSFQMRFADPEDFERCRAFVPQKNEENFDKLEAELARQTAPAGHTKETQ
ncbi:SRPBCC family protein [bacterium]|nr:SRPBCC family protein [bacterium]